MNKKVIYKDFWKAHDCQYCLYFKGIKNGCSLGEENCVIEEKPKKRHYCDGCSYGRASLCIGHCTVVDLVQMKERFKNERRTPYMVSR